MMKVSLLNANQLTVDYNTNIEQINFQTVVYLYSIDSSVFYANYFLVAAHSASESVYGLIVMRF